MAAIAPPRDLTLPEPGSRTARQVLSRALGRLLPDLCALSPRLALTEARARDLVRVQELVRGAVRAGPAAVGPLVSALRAPTIAALVRALREDDARLLYGAEKVDAVVGDLTTTLLAELALHGGLATKVELEAPAAAIVSLARRARIVPRERPVRARFSAGRVELVLGSGEVLAVERAALDDDAPPAGVAFERPFAPVVDEIVLATVDLNPRAAFGAEPGQRTNVVDLAGRSIDEWTAPLREGLALVGEFLPDLRGEIALYLQQLVPVGFDAEKHWSVSYREAIGSIYLTLHPDLMTMTEALVHEASHNKLHALLELDPVIDPAVGARFRSPVRPDPRPLRGVLLALHAYLPIARLYEQMLAAAHPLTRKHYFRERFAQVRRANREAADVVFAHAQATTVGEGLLDEMRRWMAHFDALGDA